jgi:hypothetical protein
MILAAALQGAGFPVFSNIGVTALVTFALSRSPERIILPRAGRAEVLRTECARYAEMAGATAAATRLTTGSISTTSGSMTKVASAKRAAAFCRLLALAALSLFPYAISIGAPPLDAAELMALLSQVDKSSVNFEETKHLAALTAPLVRRGTMRYVRPERLEMQVDKPYFERLKSSVTD